MFLFNKNSSINAFKKPCSFLSHTSKTWWRTPQYWWFSHPNTVCLASSNGICTKRNTARVAVRKQLKSAATRTYPLDKPSSFISRPCFWSELCLWKNKTLLMWRWIWIWTKWQISVLANIHMKRYQRVILSWRMLFEVAFRCMFYQSFGQKKSWRSLLWTHYCSLW